MSGERPPGAGESGGTADGGLTHLDAWGRARMVDVTPKEPTHRRAVARARVCMKPETVNKIASNAISKGDVLAVARVAGIMAAKQTPQLIPLCHQVVVGSVQVNFELNDDDVEVEAIVDCLDRTGVEMEAMTAAGMAALTIYDMVKSVDRGVLVTDLGLWEKSGGRSGLYRRETGASPSPQRPERPEAGTANLGDGPTDPSELPGHPPSGVLDV